MHDPHAEHVPDDNDQDRPDHSSTSSPAAEPHDPVRYRRAQVARAALLANRIGYLLLAVAVAVFVIAFVIGFSRLLASVVVIALIASFVLLAPSIILGYAVRAAERDEADPGSRAR